MTIAVSPSPESVAAAESSELAPTVASAQRSSWYDPDASAWEPQPPELFEALRASPAHMTTQDQARRPEAVRRP